MTLEIESADVVRLIEQYLKESNLLRTLAVLQVRASKSSYGYLHFSFFKKGLYFSTGFYFNFHYQTNFCVVW